MLMDYGPGRGFGSGYSIAGTANASMDGKKNFTRNCTRTAPVTDRAVTTN
jgi:hypothetical protein